MKNIQYTLSLLFTLIPASVSLAAGSNAWQSTPVTAITGLELKLSEPINGEMLSVLLSHDNSNNTNRLDAITIRQPFDGSDVSPPTRIDFSPNLFALGEICVENNQAYIPYIKDFNVGVIKYDGLNFSSLTIPATMTNNYDNANCAVTNDGIFILTHDLTDQETEIFKSTNSGVSYNMFGNYNSVGPFSGGIREFITADYDSGLAMTVSQMNTGMVRSTRFFTSDAFPVFDHVNLTMLMQPTGFTFVKESSGGINGDHMSFSFNGDGQAELFNIPTANPAAFTMTHLGPINSMGSQFNFQGGSGYSVPDLDGNPMVHQVMWGNLYEINHDMSPPTFTVDSDYPLMGIGGPVDGCVIKQMRGNDIIEIEGLIIGPTVGPGGTSLYLKRLEADPIFAGRFELTPTIIYDADCP
ncbi:hypothetical protein [Marinicella litoralis]|uniref:Uncharacterized protein n=1 Tax=Marinicella litoralis TaxID=644220 RepID=A0A4R6XUI9_9GAMM|nr:hypothetical protein [Marinicella litoralis]TDR23486.1 hypothetical protein C8D91_0348 [Marinicella litoralis]